jgi:hypothetical protein
MKFLIVARTSSEPDAGVLPRDKLAKAMLDFDEALANAKVTVAAEGLHPGYTGARTYARFWIIDVSSKQEAISWALRIPRAAGVGYIAIRQVNGAMESPKRCSHRNRLRERLRRDQAMKASPCRSRPGASRGGMSGRRQR